MNMLVNNPIVTLHLRSTAIKLRKDISNIQGVKEVSNIFNSEIYPPIPFKVIHVFSRSYTVYH